jgi:simple sugar transport system ATP-binding protein
MRIDIRDLHKRYGDVQANRGISLSLEPGRIYGLLGENAAGKSTLMRILAGYTRQDQGEILFDERPAHVTSPLDALALGVGMLHQDPLDFPALSVWENFVLGGVKRNKRAAIQRLLQLSTRFGFDLPPEAAVGELTVGERQQVDLLRLLDLGVKVLILDEPTTGISLAQKDMLFAVLRELAREKDRTIIVVTHMLSDALTHCDEIVVMRRGRLVGHLNRPFSAEEIVCLMFEDRVLMEAEACHKQRAADEILLSLKNASIVGESFGLPGLDLSVRSGEIVGLAGLEGNGQELLLRGLAGLAHLKRGKIIFCGKEVRGRSRTEFRRSGIAFLPAARLEEGLFADLTLEEHLCLAFTEKMSRASDLFQRRCADRFQLRAAPASTARSLSGGNQQRLLLSLIPPSARLLLLEHPTRGLDIGSSRQVWAYLEECCRAGSSVLFSSVDLDEILTHSHRVLVFHNRRLFADVPTESLNVETLADMIVGRGKAA